MKMNEKNSLYTIIIPCHNDCEQAEKIASNLNNVIIGHNGSVSYGGGLLGVYHRGWQSVKTSFLFVISAIPVENFHTNCHLCDFSDRGGK